MRFRYKPPDGPWRENVTKAYLRDLIRREGHAYWNRNAGAATLVAIDDKGRQNELSLMFQEAYGF